jgi:hypothetical protein
VLRQPASRPLTATPECVAQPRAGWRFSSGVDFSPSSADAEPVRGWPTLDPSPRRFFCVALPARSRGHSFASRSSLRSATSPQSGSNKPVFGSSTACARRTRSPDARSLPRRCSGGRWTRARSPVLGPDSLGASARGPRQLSAGYFAGGNVLSADELVPSRLQIARTVTRQ